MDLRQEKVQNAQRNEVKKVVFVARSLSVSGTIQQTAGLVPPLTALSLC